MSAEGGQPSDAQMLHGLGEHDFHAIAALDQLTHDEVTSLVAQPSAKLAPNAVLGGLYRPSAETG